MTLFTKMKFYMIFNSRLLHVSIAYTSLNSNRNITIWGELMILRLIVASLTFSCAVAHADNFSNAEAGAISAVSGVLQGRLTMKLIDAAGQTGHLLSTRVLTHEVARPLTDSSIREIVGAVEDTFLTRDGIGKMGGTNVVISYDEPELQRLQALENAKKLEQTLPATSAADLKPQMKEKVLSARLIGSSSELEAELKALADKGVVVSTVDVEGVFARAVGHYGFKAVTGVATFYFLANTASNVYRAYDFSQKAWHSTPASADLVDKCKASDTNCAPGLNIPKWLWNSADAVYYTWHANQ